MLLGYLDAGSGSMVAQAVVAGVAGAAVAAKMGWRRISSSVRKGKEDQLTAKVQPGRQ